MRIRMCNRVPVAVPAAEIPDAAAVRLGMHAAPLHRCACLPVLCGVCVQLAAAEVQLHMTC